MLRKLTKRITNNFGLKVLAAVFAIVIWLVVVNIEDPEKTKGFTIPVTIENSDYLADMGKTYDILNNSDKISFTVTGKRSIIEELSDSDFTAVANMENINDELTTVPVSVTASRYSGQIEINKRDATLKISVENLKTEKYTVKVVTKGSPAAYCYVDSTTADPKKITISGPESVLNEIATVEAVVDVSGAAEDIATNSKIILLDKSGNEIAQDRLTLNRTTVAVDVKVTMGKSVPLKFTTNGTPADGYRYETAECSTSSVKLVGSSEALAGISELEISGSQMSVAGAASDVTVTVDLTKFLPDGVELAEDQTKQISVTLVIEGRTAKAFAVPVKNITVKNLSSDLSLQFNADTVTVNILGFEEDFADINPEEITGTIDASGFNTGVLAAEVKLDGNYSVSETVYTAVTVTEKSSPGNNGTDDSSDGVNSSSQ